MTVWMDPWAMVRKRYGTATGSAIVDDGGI
jgi:hypothetical protein